METIIVEEDPSEAMQKIINANGPIRVEIFGHSCNGGSVFDMVALSTALENCKYPATAITKDCVSLIPFTGAKNIEMDDHAFLYIGPLKIMSETDDPENIKKDIDLINHLTNEISNSYSRWPPAKILFDSGEEHFITKKEAIAMGIIQQEEYRNGIYF